jgi:hypothetical protein
MDLEKQKLMLNLFLNYIIQPQMAYSIDLFHTSL